MNCLILELIIFTSQRGKKLLWNFYKKILIKLLLLTLNRKLYTLRGESWPNLSFKEVMVSVSVGRKSKRKDWSFKCIEILIKL